MSSRSKERILQDYLSSALMHIPLFLQPVISKIRSVADRYLPYGLSIKLILNAFLAALGGAGFLGYASDYATYTYALKTGVRFPLEGVPYIKAAVSTGSFFILISSAMIFGIVIFLAKTLFSLTSTMFHATLPLLRGLSSAAYRERAPDNFFTAVKNIREKSKLGIIFFLVCGGLLSGTVLCGVRYASDILLGTPVGDVSSISLYFVVVFGLTVVVNLYFLYPEKIWTSSFLLTFFYVCFLLWAMFQHDLYGKFLRTIGYGGGIPIIAKCKNEAAKTEICAKKITLTLRTNDSYILFDAAKSEFFEVPKEEFLFISYRSDALSVN